MVVAILVAIWVLPRAISLARAALRILSEQSPAHIDVEELRSALGGLGDSLVMADVGDGAWRVHVHVADAGAAIEAGATAIIQPGGAMRDEEVIAAADERGATMAFTGVRVFRH